MGKAKFSFLIFGLALLCCPALSQAQVADEDTIRIRTRVVFIDALVKDKKTSAPVADLLRENFEVLADGKPRTLTYFSREGEGRRRPLALVLVLDLVPYDAEKNLRRTDVLESLAAALQKLSPEDEVAVLAWVGGGNPLKTLTDFSRDHAKVLGALDAVPSLAPTRPAKSIDKLNAILQKISLAARERPDSQVVVASVTSDVAPIPYAERDRVTAGFVRANIEFSPLLVETDKKYVLLRPLLESSGRLAGDDVYGVARYVAEQTGGDVVEGHRPGDYGAALEKLIAGLSARYNLGFTLDESEQDDGHVHKLVVIAKAPDSRGRERKLIVRARRSYFIPKTK